MHINSSCLFCNTKNVSVKTAVRFDIINSAVLINYTLNQVYMNCRNIEHAILIESLIQKSIQYNISKNEIINCIIGEAEPRTPVLKEMLQLQDIFNSFTMESFYDLAGIIYQELQTSIDKKNKGQFFTPDTVAEHIISNALPTLDKDSILSFKILDPSCGSGQFLLSAFKKLLTQYISLNFSKEEAINNILNYNLFGCDIDKTALSITAYNISLFSGIPVNEIKHLYHNDYIYKDAFSLEQDSLLQHQFNLIIGNPPWGSSLSSEEKKYFRQNYYSAKSGINTFTLFIERSLELLIERGRLSFLIPEALLNIKAHSNCRELLINNTQLQNITLWGDQFKDVYAPCISLSCTTDTGYEKTNMIEISDYKSKDNTNLYIRQSDLKRIPQNIISIHYTENAINLIDHIHSQKCFYLKDNAKFFLGIVTGNNPKYISTEYSEDTPDPIITGRDVSSYQIRHSGHYFKYDSNKLQQTAPQDLYLTKNKILYKFIGKRLTFALDKEGIYTLNNVNCFIPDMETITAEAMLAILNSSLIQYFYEKSFFTVKVLRGNLERLPIKKLTGEAESLLSKLAMEAMEADKISRKQEIQDSIDDIVFHEYDIVEKEAYKIWEEYNSNKNQRILPNL